MTYASREQSKESGAPYELYLFSATETSWRLTSAAEDIIFSGAEYTAESVIRTATSQSTEVKGGHIKVMLPKDHAVAQLFVSYIPSTPLFLTIYRGHYGEADSETVVAFTGRVLSGQFTADDTCELDCAPESELLKRGIASQLFQKPCNRILYDEGCGVDKTLFRALATIASVSADGLTLTAEAFASRPDSWWATGYIEAGTDRRMVIAHVGDTITLMNPLNGLAAGAVIFIYAGCDRTYDGPGGCQVKFSNGVNFFGFQWIPSKNPFSSGVV